MAKASSHPAETDKLIITQYYSNFVSEIVQPKYLFADTHYFRTKWVPLLGGTAAAPFIYTLF